MRRVLAAGLAFAAGLVAGGGSAAAPAAQYAAVRPGVALAFPADEGAHPDFRTEWWYVTGWLEQPDGAPLGFQVTFFRTRPTLERDNPSAFAARQVLIAHAALSDPARGRLWHGERIAREGFGLATAALGGTDVRLQDWSLRAHGVALTAHVQAEDFGFDLELARRGPPLLQGQGGYSQKGPAAESASEYYSLPGLAVTGTVVRQGRAVRVHGEAWLDHEWSSAYLDAESVGWDWTGLNLADGSAAMAFRIRDRAGRARWAGGTLRAPDGTVRVYGPGEVAFTPGRTWRSPRTAITWPVEWTVRIGPLELALAPLLEDQESDSRLTTGAVYWEGAVRARRAGAPAGRGYLELTGYGEPLRLR